MRMTGRAVPEDDGEVNDEGDGEREDATEQDGSDRRGEIEEGTGDGSALVFSWRRLAE